jgi:hypothetical protein
MNCSQSLSLLAAALAKAQLQIEPATKDATNPHFRSHYATLGSIWDACRGSLNTNGLSVIQMPVDASEGRVGLTTILMHSSGEFISETVSTRPAKDDAQGVGSALTYLRRYALGAFVGVTATEDDDGNAASRPPSAMPSASRPPAIPAWQPKAEAPSRPAAPPMAPKPSAAPTQPIAPPAAPKPPQATQAQPTGEYAFEETTAVIFYKSDDGIGKNGKPYTKHRIGWMCDGEKIYGTTFSATFGEIASYSKESGKEIRIGWELGQFGADIKLIEEIQYEPTQKEKINEEEIPF